MSLADGQLMIDANTRNLTLVNREGHFPLARLPQETVGGCSRLHHSGQSVFLLMAKGDIYHYELSGQQRNPSYRWQLARVIPTKTEARDCLATDSALLFIDDSGVYQVDLGLDAGDKVRWLSSPSLLASPSAVLGVENSIPYVTDGISRQRVDVEIDVVGDRVDRVTPSVEIDFSMESDTLLIPRQLEQGQLLTSTATMLIFTPLKDMLLSRFKPNSPGILSSISTVPDYATIESSKLGIPGVEATIDLPGSGTLVASLDDKGRLILRQLAATPVNGQVIRSLGSLVLPSPLAHVCLTRLGSTASSFSLFGVTAAGEISRWQVQFKSGQLTAEKQWVYSLARPATSCLVDERLQRLYVLEPEVGIWAFNLTKQAPRAPRQVTSHYIVESLQGIALYEAQDAGFLITQSTGDGSFLIFDRKLMRLVGRFQIVADVPTGIDGAMLTSGYLADSHPIPGFPRGVLVVLDLRNRLPPGKPNLKIVDWQRIEGFLSTK